MSKIDTDTQIFEECLNSFENGEPMEQILSRYPDQADEIRPLLQTALQTRRLLNNIQVPAGARSRSRAKFLAAARASQKPVIAVPLPIRSNKMSLQLRLAFALTMIAILAGSFGAVKVSARAVPGDALYPLKRAAEDTKLLLERNPDQRLKLEEEFNQERISEIETLISEARSSVPIDFGGPVEAIGPEWQIKGVRILTDEHTEIDGLLQTGDYAYIHGTLAADGSVTASKIESEKIQVHGVILTASGETWQVGETSLTVNQRTQIQGLPLAGAVVKIDGILLGNNNILAIKVEVEKLSPESPQVIQVQPTATFKPSPTATIYVRPTEHEEPSKTPEPTDMPQVKPTEVEHVDPTDTPKPSKTPKPTDTDDHDGGNSGSSTESPTATEKASVTASPTKTPEPTSTKHSKDNPTKTPTRTPTRTPTKAPDND